jgi:hypothetical protein
MRQLILSSNHRLRLALLIVRVMGRNPATLAEVRDALNQRRAMRQQCRFALWLISHERELRHRFDHWLGRHQFALATHGSEQAAFRQFCLSEYQLN